MKGAQNWGVSGRTRGAGPALSGPGASPGARPVTGTPCTFVPGQRWDGPVSWVTLCSRLSRKDSSCLFSRSAGLAGNVPVHAEPWLVKGSTPVFPCIEPGSRRARRKPRLPCPASRDAGACVCSPAPLCPSGSAACPVYKRASVQANSARRTEGYGDDDGQVPHGPFLPESSGLRSSFLPPVL